MTHARRPTNQLRRKYRLALRNFTVTKPPPAALKPAFPQLAWPFQRRHGQLRDHFPDSLAKHCPNPMPIGASRRTRRSAWPGNCAACYQATRQNAATGIVEVRGPAAAVAAGTTVRSTPPTPRGGLTSTWSSWTWNERHGCDTGPRTPRPMNAVTASALPATDAWRPAPLPAQRVPRSPCTPPAAATSPRSRDRQAPMRARSPNRYGESHGVNPDAAMWAVTWYLDE
jgi:hypothetical protein